MSGGKDPLISDNGALRQVSAQLQIMVTLTLATETPISIKIAGMDFFGTKIFFSCL